MAKQPINMDRKQTLWPVDFSRFPGVYKAWDVIKRPKRNFPEPGILKCQLIIFKTGIFEEPTFYVVKGLDNGKGYWEQVNYVQFNDTKVYYENYKRTRIYPISFFEEEEYDSSYVYQVSQVIGFKTDEEFPKINTDWRLIEKGIAYIKDQPILMSVIYNVSGLELQHVIAYPGDKEFRPLETEKDKDRIKSILYHNYGYGNYPRGASIQYKCYLRGEPINMDGKQSSWPVDYSQYPVYKAWESIFHEETTIPTYTCSKKLKMQFIILQDISLNKRLGEYQYYLVQPIELESGKAIWKQVSREVFMLVKRNVGREYIGYIQVCGSREYYRIPQVIGPIQDPKFPECNKEWRIIQKGIVYSYNEPLFMLVIYDKPYHDAKLVIADLSDKEFREPYSDIEEELIETMACADCSSKKTQYKTIKANIFGQHLRFGYPRRHYPYS